MKTLEKFLALLIAAGVAAAQTPSATVVGRVLDPTGAAVSGATVRVRPRGQTEWCEVSVNLLK